MNWKTIESAPQDVPLMTKIDDAKGCRNEQIMTLQGRLWYAGDMYVCYSPTHYRELTPIEVMRLKNDEERKAIDRLERAAKQ